MALRREVMRPVRRHYVLKLDHDADPARGAVSGRLENLATGSCFDFADVTTLLEGLTRELATNEPAGPVRDA